MLRPAIIATLLCCGAAAVAAPEVTPADIQALRKELRRPGARAVLVNVWATFCDPCVEELPELLRFFKDHGKRGLRLVLVSVDDPDDREKVAKFLAERGVDFRSYLKQGDDMAFIDGLDKRWSGALPASFLLDGAGAVKRFWLGQVTYEQLAAEAAPLLGSGSNSKNSKRR